MAERGCKSCGQPDGLTWSDNGQDGYKLVDIITGVPHYANCAIRRSRNTVNVNSPPVTRRDEMSGQTPAPVPVTLSEEFKQRADSAVMDAVSQVMDSFQRSIANGISDAERDTARFLDEYRTQLNTGLDDALAHATRTILDMIPQVHEIRVRTLIGNNPGVDGPMLEGRPHMQLQRMVDWLNIREHVWSAGPAGSGKTTAAEQAAGILDLPSYTISCGMGTNDWSLIGFTSPDGKYIPGHLREPYEHGGVFILDEIDNTPAPVLTTINGALSGTHYTFPDAVVKRHPDFVAVGCANTWGQGPDRMYVGRAQLDAATLDRFKKVPWNYDEEAEFDWAGRDQTKWIEYVQRARKYAMDQMMRVVISPRASISGAKALRNGIALQVVLEDCLWNGMSPDDSLRIYESVGACYE